MVEEGATAVCTTPLETREERANLATVMNRESRVEPPKRAGNATGTG